MTESMSLQSVPLHMRESIIRYLLQGIPFGSFLSAVFADSLVEAAGAADGTNINILPAYARFLYNHAPRGSWGSRERVAAWVDQGGSPLDTMRLPEEWRGSVAVVVASIKTKGLDNDSIYA